MTDASVCGSTGIAGYGYWVVSLRGGNPGQGLLKGKIADSFEGELKAVVNALKDSLNKNHIQYGDHVVIQLDNSGVVNCIKGVNKVRPKDIHVLDIFKQLLRINNITVDARHIKGHTSKKDSRYVANMMCDKRAKHEMRKARDQNAKK